MGGISLWQIAIVIIIIAILFGGKRLRNLGGDLGTSLKGFKKAIKDDDEPKKTDHLTNQSSTESSPTDTTSTDNQSTETIDSHGSNKDS
ncbi:twin-arginine translocase TatA/TatE family subunit [Ostreibacterium oceani]|uniref:Sec-independent protein translocase protein TatA n=1 Tax=Ostreibacterium oceani TaxID=2654998 RepID=A0A6N7F138_9GAMM|nr:twin-arginine translocase TatA/TatE family subunit [Ostreibacterium oceani]MPV85566.1 twin-arginine translocase TatA/TatE family subunit [Ostreibacterium oceani]